MSQYKTIYVHWRESRSASVAHTKQYCPACGARGLWAQECYTAYICTGCECRVEGLSPLQAYHISGEGHERALLRMLQVMEIGEDCQKIEIDG